MFARHAWDDGPCFSSQTWKASRQISEFERLVVEFRFDDNLRNGHNTFAATADLYDKRQRREGSLVSCGCLHDEIAQHFPELAPLLRWHLCSTDGPMHYEANVVYLAGDRDCWGLRAGESRQIRNGKTGLPCWILKGARTQYHDGETPPAETPAAPVWEPLLRIGEGKARELDAARRVAAWPDATDAELCAEPEQLRAALRARLPALIAEFRRDMEAAGFAWEANAAGGAA
ncbi:MAG: hypothetical protein AB7P78_19960 [Candidatus Binatia bacterium]